MTKKKKIIIFLGILLVIFVFAFIAFFNSKKRSVSSSGIPKDAPMVQVEKAHREKIISLVKAEGVVEFLDDTKIYSSSQAKIKKVNFKEGDTVNIGDVLVEYDSEALDDLKDQLSQYELDVKSYRVSLEAAKLPADESDIKEAENAISKAENDIETQNNRIEQQKITVNQSQISVDNAQRDYDNNKILFDRGTISKSELDNFYDKLVEVKNKLESDESQYQSELLSLEGYNKSLELAKNKYDSLINKNNTPSSKKDIEAKQVALQQAQLKVSQKKEEINKFKLKEISEVQGTVVKVSAEEGATLSVGTELMKIANLDNMVIKADVAEYDMADIKIGQDVTIKGDALPNNISGKVSKIYPVAESKTKNSSGTKTYVTVEITTNEKQNLKSGYSIDTEIITSISENAIVVPVMSYITEKDDSAFVYIVKDDYTVEKRTVELKAYSDMNVEVLGVNEGEKVISNPGSSIYEGMIVNPVDSSAEAVSEQTSNESSSDGDTTESEE